MVMRGVLGAAVLVGLLGASAAQAEVAYTESPRSGALSFKLGGYRPDEIDQGVSGTPYHDVFGNGSMLMFEFSWDQYLYQQFGAAGVGLTLGYAEKYGAAQTTGTDTSEKTGLHVLPVKLMGLYNFDYAAREWGVPLVPYGRFGLVYVPWWSSKGGGVEYVNGTRIAGARWGYGAVVGLRLMLDYFEPRLARDFDSDLGVNHSYLFAEWDWTRADGFGSAGPNLSDSHWMFGLTLEF